MEMFFMLVSSILLLGLIAFTTALELENQKREKRAKTKTWQGWSIND